MRISLLFYGGLFGGRQAAQGEKSDPIGESGRDGVFFAPASGSITY
jgi:hypothetical protein